MANTYPQTLEGKLREALRKRSVDINQQRFLREQSLPAGERESLEPPPYPPPKPADHGPL